MGVFGVLKCSEIFGKFWWFWKVLGVLGGFGGLEVHLEGFGCFGWFWRFGGLEVWRFIWKVLGVLGGFGGLEVWRFIWKVLVEGFWKVERVLMDVGRFAWCFEWFLAFGVCLFLRSLK